MTQHRVRHLAAMMLLFAACGEVPATQVIVTLSAEPELRADARYLRVRVTNLEGEEVLDQEVDVPDGAVLARVPIAPRDGDASRHVTLQAALLDAAREELATIEATFRFNDSELRELRLTFEAACAGLTCDEGQTCVSGTCVGACFDAAPLDERATSGARCGPCERCAGAICEPRADGSACGCEGDTCLSGRCVVAQPVAVVAAGTDHTCALVRPTDGSVRVDCWGSNRAGQLGLPTADTERESSPIVAYRPPTTWIADLVGDALMTCTLLGGDWSRVCWGSNVFGQLGDGTSGSRVPITRLQDLDLRGLSGGNHFCGRTGSGELWCWGYNARGQLGRGTEDRSGPTPERVGDRESWQVVEAQGLHTCAIHADRTLWCWGFNNSGELGVGDRVNRLTPARVGCAPDQVETCFDDWVSVANGEFHSCGLRADGSLWCWGGHGGGQLGIGAGSEQATDPRPVARESVWDAVVAGFRNTCAIRDDGRLFCWGGGTEGQIGDGSRERRSVPVEVIAPPSSGERWDRVSIGGEHVCATRSDGALYCWGSDADGQVGVGATTPRSWTTPRRVCFSE